MSSDIFGLIFNVTDAERDKHFAERFTRAEAPIVLPLDDEEAEFAAGVGVFEKLFAPRETAVRSPLSAEAREIYANDALESFRKYIAYEAVASQPTENPATSDWNEVIPASIPVVVAKTTEPADVLAKRATAAVETAIAEQRALLAKERADKLRIEELEAERDVLLQSWLIKKIEEEGATVDELVADAADAEVGKRIRAAAELLNLNSEENE
jgi:hypothetical protein